jgi:hypothetical protein
MKTQPSILPKTLPKKPSFTPTKSTPTPTLIPLVHETFASALAKRARPTILYQAPSHTGFMVGCYLTGSFCILYGVIAFNLNYIQAPPDVSWWILVAFGGVSLGMIILGTRLILGPAGVINHIRAIPRSVSDVSRASSSRAKAAQPELQIEVELKKMFPVPFFPARKIYVNPGEIELPFPLSAGSNRGAARSVKEERAQRLEEEAARQKALEYEYVNLLCPNFIS